MELILMLVEGLVALIDLLALGADAYAWRKGRENRQERKAARQAGLEIPPKDKWNRLVVVLTLLVLGLTIGLLLWKIGKP